MIDADRRYYGIYEGLVVDANDPEEVGRIQVKVPQLFGNNITDWVRCSSGGIGQSKYPYGTFFTTANQNIGTTSTTIINWDTIETNKIELENNRFNIEEEGDYLINISATVKKDSLGFSEVELWVKKNGSNVANSASSVTSFGLHSDHTIPTAYTHVAPNGGGPVTNNHTNMVIDHSGTSPNQVITQSFILNLLAKDYLEFACSADVSGSYLNRITTGAGPATPGVIATINLVGKWKPQPGTIVWIMFIAGDPNFPIWIGAE